MDSAPPTALPSRRRRHAARLARELRSATDDALLHTGVARLLANRRSTSEPDITFIWVPKTAGNSLWAALGATKHDIFDSLDKARLAFPNRGMATFGHMDYLELRRQGIVTDRYDEAAFKFCVVRNPFDRAVSLFKYLGRIGRLPPTLPFDMFASLIRDRGYEPVGLYNSRGLSQCNPQISWTLGPELGRLVDEIYRFEDLEAAAHSLQVRFALRATLPHLNATPGDDYRSYYSKASREDIVRAYSRDFAEFGYSDEL